MRRPSRAQLATGAFLAVGMLAVASSSGQTYARFSDFEILSTGAGATVWAPDPIPSLVPAECNIKPNQLKGYTVIEGTEASEIIEAGNGKHIVFGHGGDDTITGWNGKGNGKDCLIGGAGDDDLSGRNAKDVMIGGPGDDICSGGHAPDTYSCEYADEADKHSKRLKASEIQAPSFLTGGDSPLGGPDETESVAPSEPSDTKPETSDTPKAGEPKDDPASSPAPKQEEATGDAAAEPSGPTDGAGTGSTGTTTEQPATDTAPTGATSLNEESNSPTGG